jgi:hypothetical protein
MCRLPAERLSGCECRPTLIMFVIDVDMVPICAVSVTIHEAKHRDECRPSTFELGP